MLGMKTRPNTYCGKTGTRANKKLSNSREYFKILAFNSTRQNFDSIRRIRRLYSHFDIFVI